MLDWSIHRKYMFDIIKDIYQSPLKNSLWFKWWTLCYFLYWLDRFSTDLDFDLLNLDYKNIKPIVREILKKYWVIKDEYDKKFTIFFLLDYWKDEKNIKIELSKKKSINDEYENINFYWTDIWAMKKNCIFANKLMALHRRMKNRDLFDVYYFFKNDFPVKEILIEEQTWMSYQELLMKLKQEIPNKFNEKTLLAEVWDLVTEKQKNFIKTKLVKEVLWYIDFSLKFYK